MNLEPLPGSLDLTALAALEAKGEMLACARDRRPKSLDEILREASQRMDREDAANDAYLLWLSGRPVRHVMKRPRRTLRRLLRQHR